MTTLLAPFPFLEAYVAAPPLPTGVELLGESLARMHGRRQGYSPVCHGIPKILEINTNAYMYTYKYNVYSCYMV